MATRNGLTGAAIGRAVRARQPHRQRLGADALRGQPQGSPGPAPGRAVAARRFRRRGGEAPRAVGGGNPLGPPPRGAALDPPPTRGKRHPVGQGLARGCCAPPSLPLLPTAPNQRSRWWIGSAPTTRTRRRGRDMATAWPCRLDPVVRKCGVCLLFPAIRPPSRHYATRRCSSAVRRRFRTVAARVRISSSSRAIGSARSSVTTWTCFPA